MLLTTRTVFLRERHIHFVCATKEVDVDVVVVVAAVVNNGRG